MAVKVGRIEKEFIIKSLSETGTAFELVIAEAHFHTHVVHMHQNELTLILPNSIPNLNNRSIIDAFISFKGTRVTCRLPFIACKDTKLTVGIPDNLYRDLSRGFERIRPAGSARVSLLLDGITYKMDFPQSEEFYEPEAPSINVKFDATRITSLLKAFREKAMSFSSDNKIVMFRERKPESIIEELLAISGRILVLPLEGAKILTQKTGGTNSRILEKDDILRFLKVSGADPVQKSQELLAHIDGMKQKKIWHELYCPVLFREYVVGYIYLIRSDQQVMSFSQTTLDFVVQFGRLLSYSLQQNGYYQQIPVRETFKESVLVDISGSGMLFSMPLSGPSLEIMTDIDFEISLGSKNMPVRGRVMRRFQDSGRVYIGVKFLEISLEDQSYLMSYLYGENPDLFADQIVIP